MSTWTLEHAKAVVAAWPEVDYYNVVSRMWIMPNRLIHTYTVQELGDATIFRLPPKKRMVEWTASDVKPGMVFRVEGWVSGQWKTIHGVVISGIVWSESNQDRTDWARLKEVWQWSTDAVNWHPCAKEVEG